MVPHLNIHEICLEFPIQINDAEILIVAMSTNRDFNSLNSLKDMKV